MLFLGLLCVCFCVCEAAGGERWVVGRWLGRGGSEGGEGGGSEDEGDDEDDEEDGIADFQAGSACRPPIGPTGFGGPPARSGEAWWIDASHVSLQV